MASSLLSCSLCSIISSALIANTVLKFAHFQDNMMFFYYDIKDKKAHEVLCLTGYSCAATSVRDYKYCFALIPPTMKRWNSVLVFANENKHSYDR